MKNKLVSILHFLDCDFTLSKRQVLFAFLALLIIGLGLRCGYWAMRDRPPRDEKFYIQTVNDINNNMPNWFEKNDYPPPLMQRIAALSCHGGFSAETALHTLNMVYAMLWVWVIFFLCRDVFDSDKAGLLGMALAAFNPYSVRMACQILREPLYILLFTLSLWCTVRLIKSEKVNFFYPAFIGVMTILGFYTRFEGVEIALFIPLAAIILCKKQCFRQAAANFTIYFLTITLLAAGLLYAGDSYMQKIPGKISWVSEVNNRRI
jgi:asparagine N-glycosylation enzyme membrane subunit Stt3